MIWELINGKLINNNFFQFGNSSKQTEYLEMLSMAYQDVPEEKKSGLNKMS